MQKYIPLILAVVTTNALSQLLLKHGMNVTGKFEFNSEGILQTIPKVILNPFILLGGFMLVFSTCLHLMSLSRVDVSFAYPFLSLAYVIVLIASYYLFGENINAFRIAGICFICVGTALIAQS